MFNDKLTKSVADAVRQCISEEQKETQVQLNESKYTETKDKQGKMKSWKYEGDWEDSKEKKEGRGKVTHMSDVARRATEKTEKDDEKNVKEEVELTEPELEEMSGAGWSAQKVHGHLKKSGWTLARTGGGHDVFTHPKATKHIAVPRHKGDLKAPLVQGILKTVKMTTEAVEQLDEISKETLGSYIRKASGDRASATRAAGVEAGARGPNRWARMDAKEKRAEKRGVGISKAVTRLTKEELEEGLFPGTPEYEKKFGKVPQEMKQGQKKKTHQGEMEKTGKGVVHRRSFREMVELYQVEGVKGLFEEISVMQEEASEEEFNAELKKQKDKAEGKAPQADVAAAATQGTKDMKEEVELEEAQYGVNLGSRSVSGQKEYQGKEIKSFHPNKEKEAREFADKHGYVVKKNMLPAGNSITHTWDIHKEEVEDLEERTLTSTEGPVVRKEEDEGRFTPKKPQYVKNTAVVSPRPSSDSANVKLKEEDELNEVSNELLTRYKNAAGKDARESDKKGDFKRGDKRFGGIIKATIKQFDNDKKKSMKTESTENKKEKEDDKPPFDPPYETKNRATPGKYGKGYSTARHLARMTARKAAGMKTEEVEHIDELNKSTLGSYIKKASHDVATKGAMTRQFGVDSRKARDEEEWVEARKKEQMADKTFKKSWKRREGMAKAVDRLTKEEVDSSKTRKADIVRSAYESAKAKKKQKEVSKDKFQADPELTTQIIRND